MAQTFLNGKVTVTSMAAPTQQDLETLHNLSKEDHAALLREVIDRGAKSPMSTRSREEILERALQRAEKIKQNQEHEL